jgi:hypothetical protein
MMWKVFLLFHCYLKSHLSPVRQIASVYGGDLS